jgi:RNA polymerase sigma factor (sigma-70 family)
MNEQLSAFYIKYHDKLVAWIAASAARSEQDAEELAQNTYESVLKYYSYDGSRSFVSYVYMVARKMVARYLELGNNYWSHSINIIDMDNDAAQSEPANQTSYVYDKWMRKVVTVFLLSLPPRQLQVATQVMDDSSYMDIRGSLGISESSITSNWQVVLDKGKSWFSKLAIDFS